MKSRARKQPDQIIENKKRYIVLVQAAAILRYLSSDTRIRANVTEISKQVGISKSKAYHILVVLQNIGFVIKADESKLYSLGLGIIPIGQKALGNINYRKIARPFLQKLARETMCTVLFGLISGQKLFIVAKEASGREVDSRLDIGDTVDIFLKSHGKAILAALPEEDREKLLSGSNFFNDFEGCVIDNSELRRLISDTRQKGFAMDSSRVSPVIKVYSSAVVGHDQYPVGVIMVMGLMKKSVGPKYASKLVKTAKDLSNTLVGRVD
jgi:DNA-binding IclR family transcriptional regulator